MLEFTIVIFKIFVQNCSVLFPWILHTKIILFFSMKFYASTILKLKIVEKEVDTISCLSDRRSNQCWLSKRQQSAGTSFMKGKTERGAKIPTNMEKICPHCDIENNVSEKRSVTQCSI